MDCLIISYSEPSRNRERHQFFSDSTRHGNGWGRFLHLNYVEYDKDIFLPNQLASLAKLKRENHPLKKTPDGHYDESDIATYSAWKIPLLGGIYLYQHLKKLSLDVDLIQHAQLEKEALEIALKKAPRVIAISTTLLLNPLDIAGLVKYCRSLSPESVIVVGGISVWNHYLANKDKPDIFEGYKADVVVLDNKGFRTLGSIVTAVRDRKSLEDIPNLILYERGNITVTPKQHETFDFKTDALDWNLVENRFVGQITLIRTQISCPFSCSFCSYPVTQGAVLKMEMDTFEQEIRVLRDKGVKYLLFVDDTFNVPMRRFKSLLSVLTKYDFKWVAFIRCQYLDEEGVQLMKQSGCVGAYLGIESGSDEILKLMNKRVTAADYFRGVELLAKYGVTTYGSFITGFPGETESTIKETKHFIENSGIDYFNIKIFFYDPTTPIASQADRFDLTGYGMQWTHNTMDSKEAFAIAENQIIESKLPYIPQHSGEIWELAYFHERGISEKGIRTLYNNFTQMLRDELTQSPLKKENQKRLFGEIQSYF